VLFIDRRVRLAALSWLGSIVVCSAFRTPVPRELCRVAHIDLFARYDTGPEAPDVVVEYYCVCPGDNLWCDLGTSFDIPWTQHGRVPQLLLLGDGFFLGGRDTGRLWCVHPVHDRDHRAYRNESDRPHVFSDPMDGWAHLAAGRGLHVSSSAYRRCTVIFPEREPLYTDLHPVASPPFLYSVRVDGRVVLCTGVSDVQHGHRVHRVHNVLRGQRPLVFNDTPKYECVYGIFEPSPVVGVVESLYVGPRLAVVSAYPAWCRVVEETTHAYSDTKFRVSKADIANKRGHRHVIPPGAIVVTTTTIHTWSAAHAESPRTTESIHVLIWENLKPGPSPGQPARFSPIKVSFCPRPDDGQSLHCSHTCVACPKKKNHVFPRPIPSPHARLVARYVDVYPAANMQADSFTDRPSIRMHKRQCFKDKVSRYLAPRRWEKGTEMYQTSSTSRRCDLWNQHKNSCLSCQLACGSDCEWLAMQLIHKVAAQAIHTSRTEHRPSTTNDAKQRCHPQGISKRNRPDRQ
jgi:hypothetical protein